MPKQIPMCVTQWLIKESQSQITLNCHSTPDSREFLVSLLYVTSTADQLLLVVPEMRLKEGGWGGPSVVALKL